jgi:TorA maturation chaperone TorD
LPLAWPGICGQTHNQIKEVQNCTTPAAATVGTRQRQDAEIGRSSLATDADTGSDAPIVAERDGLDLARARHWQLLGLVLRSPPDSHTLGLLTGLEGDASPLGEARAALAAAARAAEPARLEREYHHLFIGVGRGELLPYASYYRTGFLNEKPLASLRADLARLGIERAPGRSDPEDHIASLAEVMAGLIAGDFAVEPGEQQHFFNRHLEPWAGRFFADLESAEAAVFFRPVGSIGRQLVEIEATAYTLAA